MEHYISYIGILCAILLHRNKAVPLFPEAVNKAWWQAGVAVQRFFDSHLAFFRMLVLVIFSRASSAWCEEVVQECEVSDIVRV